MALALLTPRRSNVAAAPAELGDVVDAGQIMKWPEFAGRVSREWILEHVAPDQKWYMGRVAVWYEGHVRAWLPTWVAQQQERAKRGRRRSGR